MRRTRWEAAQDKRDNVNKMESHGLVADSTEVRSALIARMHAGELTLTQVQDELKRIKRNAKKNGLVTKSQAFNRG